MRNIADRFVVVLDANVLFPFRVGDALLRFAEAGLYRARWSPVIIDEWKRNLLAKKPSLALSIEAQLCAMDEAFPESSIVAGQDFIDRLALPDPDDRHVLATAIVAGAEHIVTENLKDFPDEALLPYDIKAVSADDFLSSTFELYPAEALATLKAMRKDYENPTFTPDEFIFDIQAKGMPKLAALLKANIEAI